MKLETIQESIKIAMKTHATLEVETLRGVVAAVKKAAIDRQCEITEALVDEMLLKEVKIIKEQIDTCPADRPQMLENYKDQMKIVAEFAPMLMANEAEIKEAVTKLINEAELEFTKSNRGAIMKVVAANLKGKADMSIVSKVVGEILK